MVELFRLQDSLRDELFKYYSLQNHAERNLLERLVFETSLMSMEGLYNDRQPKMLLFDALPQELLRQTAGKLTIGDRLAELRVAGCDQRVVVLYSFLIASAKRVKWKAKILAPDLKALRRTASKLQTLIRVPIFRPEILGNEHLTAPKVEQAALLVETYATFVENVTSALKRFSRKNYLREQLIRMLGDHIQQTTKKPIPWEVLAALVNWFGDTDESAENLRKTFQRAYRRRRDKTAL
jgi:hypothetical protein